MAVGSDCRPLRLVFFFFGGVGGDAFGVSAEDDVGTATGHVGGDCYASGDSGFGDDVGLGFVLFGVEYAVIDVAFLEKIGDYLRFLDRCSAD